MIKRKNTRQIKVGSVKIGGGAPVSIQSMTKIDTSDVKAVVAQIQDLERSGCEIVRLAIKTPGDAGAICSIKRKVKIPIVADIHFDYRLALAAIKTGADKIRLNPGNMRKREEIAQVIKAAKKAGIPIRIGVNSGSLFTNDERRTPPTRQRAGQATNDALVASALHYIKIFEDLDFRDIIISLKASDVITTVEAYRKMSGLCDYPLHLGVTASGSYDQGIVKSAIGIGALLADGIGDTIRVSLTADPIEEVIAAKRILSAVGLRRFGPEIISCPTCGRCRVDLGAVVQNLEQALYASAEGGSASGGKRYTLYANRPLKIAIMGCEVNGPGEAKEADIGIAAGKGSGVLFVKGKIVKRVKEKDFVTEMLKVVSQLTSLPVGQFKPANRPTGKPANRL